MSAAGSTVTIPVTLSITPVPAAVMLVPQSALGFTAVAQGGAVLPETFGILTIGQGSMSWTASAATLSCGNWLQLSSPAGTVGQPYLDVSLVGISVDSTGLATGTYYGQIQAASPQAANTPQLLTVILTALPAGAAGKSPSSQNVTIANPAGNADSYASGMIGIGFVISPASAALPTGRCRPSTC